MDKGDSKKWSAGKLLAETGAADADAGEDATWVADDEAELIGELGADEDEPAKLRRMMGKALRGAAVAPRPYPHLFDDAAGVRFRLDDEPRGRAAAISDESDPSAAIDAALARMEERRRHLEALFAYRGPASISKDAARARAMAGGAFIDDTWARLWDEMVDREEKSLAAPPEQWTDSGAEDGPLHPVDEFAANHARAMEPEADGEPQPRPMAMPMPTADPVSRFEAAWAELKRWIEGAKR